MRSASSGATVEYDVELVAILPPRPGDPLPPRLDE
jgi:hypothetical protein